MNLGITILLFVVFITIMSFPIVWITMIMIGAIGSMFGILTFVYMSFWEVFILFIIIGFMARFFR